MATKRGASVESNRSTASGGKHARLDTPLYPCLFCSKKLHQWTDLQKHLVKEEPSIQLFLCHICSRAFFTNSALRHHNCPKHVEIEKDGVKIRKTWAERLKSANAEGPLVMKMCYQFLACADCGLYIPLWKDNEKMPPLSSDMYTNLLNHHYPQERLKSVSVYTMEKVFLTADTKHASVTFPVPLTKIPLSCKKCGYTYKWIGDIENHERINHKPSDVQEAPLRCPEEKCAKSFWSQFAFRCHVETHTVDEQSVCQLLLHAPSVKPQPLPKPIDKDKYGEEAAIICDLCGQWAPVKNYNKEHDCALDYTRRLLVNNQLIKCPAPKLIDLSIKKLSSEPFEALMSTLVQETAQLSFETDGVLAAQKLGKGVEEYNKNCVSCSICCAIFDQFTAMRAHIQRSHQTNEVNGLYKFIGLTGRGVECPLCGVKVCSVAGVRRHALLAHGFWIPLANSLAHHKGIDLTKEGAAPLLQPKPSATRDVHNVSQVLSPVSGSLRVSCRSDGYLVIESGDQQANRVDASVGGPTVGGTRSVVLVPSNAVHPVSQPNAAAEKWFCPICNIRFEEVGKLTAHLKQQHIFICSACPAAFVYAEKRAAHLANCKSTCNKSSTFLCCMCSTNFSELKQYYVHIIEMHPTRVNFDESNGEIHPICVVMAPTDTRHPTPPTAISRPAVSVGSAASLAQVTSVYSAASPLTNGGDGQQSVKKEQKPLQSTASVQPNKAEEDDDDLMVIEDVKDAPKNVEPIPSKPKKFKCNLCSLSFQTNAGRNEHLQTHSFDAGSTTELTLPVPLNQTVYVCRLCCLAYEMETTYRNHMKKHGAHHSCPHCTATCFTDKQLSDHLSGHVKPDYKYGCASCLKAFLTEELLHTHLNVFHKRCIIWICKVCGFAHSAREQLRNHILRSHRDVKMAEKEGVCAHAKLHFQPADVDAYQRTIEATPLKLPVAECMHRSFLVMIPPETLLACETCGSLVASSRMMLENQRLRKMEKVTLTLDSAAGVATGSSSASTIMCNRSAPVVPQGMRLLAPPRYSSARPVAPVPPKALPTVATTVHSARPMYIQPHPVQPRMPQLQQRPRATPAVSQIQSATTCQYCRRECGTKAALHVHRITHLPSHKAFCLDCGHSANGAAEYAQHASEFHRNKCLFTFCCSACGLQMPKTNLQTFRSHACHMRVGYRCDICYQLLPSHHQMLQHRDSHMSTSFCFLCTQTMENELALSQHCVLLHATVKWTMCRECGLCFNDDQSLQKHFYDEHCSPSNGYLRQCLICANQLQDAHLPEHIITRHKVMGFKMKTDRD